MATVEKRNWGLGFLLSVVLAAGMMVNSYINFQEAQDHCFQCFEGQYDFLKNDLFPAAVLWLGGLLAGLVFHFYVTPAIVSQKFGIVAILASIIGFFLIFVAAAGYGLTNIDLWRNDDGPEAFRYFSALHVIQDSLKVFMVILAYEAGTELYYFLVARAKENRSLVLKTLAEFILFSAVLFILWYIGKISYTVMTGDENEYSRIAQMRFWI
nr:hypothetical protein [Haliscomenobacter sp.]